jgi:hypothetical protein
VSEETESQRWFACIVLCIKSIGVCDAVQRPLSRKMTVFSQQRRKQRSGQFCQFARQSVAAVSADALGRGEAAVSLIALLQSLSLSLCFDELPDSRMVSLRPMVIRRANGHSAQMGAVSQGTLSEQPVQQTTHVERHQPLQHCRSVERQRRQKYQRVTQLRKGERTDNTHTDTQHTDTRDSTAQTDNRHTGSRQTGGTSDQMTHDRERRAERAAVYLNANSANTAPDAPSEVVCRASMRLRESSPNAAFPMSPDPTPPTKYKPMKWSAPNSRVHSGATDDSAMLLNAKWNRPE